MLNLQKPDFSKVDPRNNDYESEKRDALDYARIELSLKDLKEETIKYVKSNKIKTKYNLRKIDDHQFLIIGKYAWILNNNGALSSESMDFFNNRLQEVLSIKVIEAPKEETVTVSDRNKLEGSNLFQSLEDLILEDRMDENEIYNVLLEMKPTPHAVQHTIRKINSIIEEINSSDDEYKNSLNDHVKIIGDLNIIKSELQTFRENTITRQQTETQKSTGRGKNSRIYRATSNVKYKKEDHDLKLVSINPMSISNTSALMTYNTKTRKLSLYYALDSKGLEVRGTSIHNYDPKKSFQKTLRKPDEQLKFFRNVSLKRVEIVLNDYIKGKKHAISSRINENVILMEAW